MAPHADSAPPEDPATLMAVIEALQGELAEERAARQAAELGLQAKTLEAERLRVQIARLRHERFGRSSERLTDEVEQLELRLDEVLADIATVDGDTGDEAAQPPPQSKPRHRGRRPLPESLPRRDVEHLPAEGCTCQACGGALRKVGEDVSGSTYTLNPGISPRPVRGGAPRPPRILLPVLRDHDAGANAEPADRARQTRSRAAGPCAGLEVLRSSAPLSPVGDLRP